MNGLSWRNNISPCDDPPVFSVNKLRSPYLVKVTMDRISDAPLRKGVTIFAQIDHAAAAQQHDLSLPDTELLISGQPKLGTPSMNSAISTGLDLPLLEPLQEIELLLTQALKD